MNFDNSEPVNYRGDRSNHEGTPQLFVLGLLDIRWDHGIETQERKSYTWVMTY